MQFQAVEILCKKEKRGEELSSCQLIENCGMQDDKYADGTEKQLTIIGQSAKDWMKNQEIKGLCFTRCNANLVLAGSLEGLEIKDLLNINNATLEVTIKKECHFNQCVLNQQNIDCLLRKEFYYAKVNKSGTVSIKQ